MSGWYPDPTGRFEYRFHNDRHWTSDVSSDGRRYIDHLPAPSPAATPGGPTASHAGGGNGFAVASLVCGIVAVAIAWAPFIGVAGLLAALVGLGLSVPAMRRSRVGDARRGAAVAGLVTSVAGVGLGVLGILFSVYLVRAIDRFDHPGPTEVAITSCAADGSDVVATGELTNRSGSARDYNVRVRLGVARHEWVAVDDVGPGATATFSARDTGVARDDACAVVQVRGPAPFDLDPGLFEQ